MGIFNKEGNSLQLGRRSGRQKERGGSKNGISRLTVTRQPGQPLPGRIAAGRLQAGPFTLSCAIGQAGISRNKREGDHATPAGAFRLLCGFYRPDRGARSLWRLPSRALKPADGWCDDPENASYNRHVALPFRARHENLWREDHLYDLVIVLDHNIWPRCKYRGSAIFLHCARPDLAPTEGCIALSRGDLRRLLPCLARRAVLTVR
ncbi:MAG TPA: L,D-transpeptidase family protein [Methylocella sp.]|nr:L,D-transpeptidase family protein [Methylocella sp.]